MGEGGGETFIDDKQVGVRLGGRQQGWDEDGVKIMMVVFP